MVMRMNHCHLPFLAYPADLPQLGASWSSGEVHAPDKIGPVSKLGNLRFGVPQCDEPAFCAERAQMIDQGKDRVASPAPGGRKRQVKNSHRIRSP
jgi:hypothetical protein